MKIFIISGPSGSGKTTLVKELFKIRALKRKLAKSVSLTTRPRRSCERNRREYFFITEANFKQKKRLKKILEWTKYLGYYYATPKDFVERQLKKNKHLVLCLDLKGAFRVKRIYPANTVTIFIAAPSLKSLHERIASRCNQTKKDEISRRLRLARKELFASKRYDYYLVNKNLPQAVRQLQGIILKEINN